MTEGAGRSRAPSIAQLTKRSFVSLHAAVTRACRPIHHTPGLTSTATASSTAAASCESACSSISNPCKVKPARRSRLTGLVTRAALEQGRKVDAVDHRSDERSHHVPEKRVGGDLEHEQIVLLDPPCTLHGPHEHPVLRLGKREGAKVMLADE